MTMTTFGPLANAFAIAAVLALTTSARAQSPPVAAATAQATPPHHAEAEQAPIDAQHAGMTAMREKMMADMSASGVALDALVAKMKAAKGRAKVDAIAELLETMVQQHKAMHAEMMQMPGLATPKGSLN